MNILRGILCLVMWVVAKVVYEIWWCSSWAWSRIDPMSRHYRARWDKDHQGQTHTTVDRLLKDEDR